MKYQFLLLILVSSFFSTSLFARSKTTAKNPFYVEPYAGYFIGKIEGGGNLDARLQDTDINSLYAGLRIGLELKNGLILGVDYGQGLGSVETRNNTDGDYTQKDLGAYIGYRLTPYVRIYGSYIFKYESNLDWESPLGFDDDIEGNGLNAGISLKIASNIKIGLEYQIRRLNKFENGNNIDANPRSTTYLLNLNLPLPVPFKIK